MGSMADSLTNAGGVPMGAGTTLEVVAVEGDQTEPAANPGMPEMPTLPEGTAPEGPGSPKREAVEIEEPPTKKARGELSPELESKFLHLMEQTRKGFEVTGNALSSVQEHVDLLKKHSKDLSDLASELHVSRVSEKYYLAAVALCRLWANRMAISRTQVRKQHVVEKRDE